MQGRIFNRIETRALTVYALLSVNTLYPEQRVVVHAFFDTLLRHFPGTRLLQFSMAGPAGAPRCVYSTLDGSPLAIHQPEYGLGAEVAEEDVLPFKDGGARYWVSVYSISDVAVRPRFERRGNEEKEALEILRRLDGFTAGRQLLTKIAQFLSAPKSHTTAGKRYSAPPSTRVDAIWEPPVKEIRALLENAFRGASILRQYGPDRSHIRNMLTFLRSGDDSVRLILTPEQVDWVRGHWPQPSADFPELRTFDDALAALETPITLRGGSILLTSFQTGFVGYTGLHEPADSPLRITAYSPNRVLRLLNWVLDQGIAAHSNERERHFFYIPIHIHGTPWLCLANAWPGAPENGWDHFSMLYSAVATTIAAKIRAGVKELYLREVTRPLERYLRDEHRLARAPLADDINRAWSPLHRFFPYPRITLATATPNTPSALRLPSLDDHRIDAHEIPQQPARLPFELLDLGQIVAACEEHVTSVSRDIRRQTEQLREELDLLIPHHIKQVLQRTVIGPTSQALDAEPDPDRARLLRRSLDAATACHDNLKHWLFVAREVRGVPDPERRRLRIGPKLAGDLTPAACGISHFSEVVPPLAIHFHPDLAGVELPISTDVFRIVLNILLTNALAAMERCRIDAESRRIEIRLDAAPQNGRPAVVISVRNTGTFIDADLRAKAGREVLKRDSLFEKGAPHGGLGLFILQKLLRLCNARPLPCDRHFDFETQWSEIPADRWAKVYFILPVSSATHG
jgi:signal transduction histidine kinase